MGFVKLLPRRLAVTLVFMLLSWGHISFAQTAVDRLNSIEKLYPALDKIGEQYAATNHFPGFVFGLLVDGKLVH